MKHLLAALCLLVLVSSSGAADAWKSNIRYPVESRKLTFIMYEAKTKTLTVGYAAGSVVEYYGVPSTLFVQLMDKRIKGGFLSANIEKRFPKKALSRHQ